jgi:hypothetical protein
MKHTSQEWQDILKDVVVILDPDGWDRTPTGWDYSWNQELITLEEWAKRMFVSTISAPKGFRALVDRMKF